VPGKTELLTLSRSRFGFCLAVAVIAAAVADPIVEFSANAGWFGSTAFTDHSNLDVFPALILGVALMALYFVRRSRAILAGRTMSTGIAVMIPAIFVLQMATLYVMETLEQLVVWGHPLAAGVWLGGPLLVSMAVHAAVCSVVAFVIARSRRRLAATTLRVIRLVHALVTFAATSEKPLAARGPARVCIKELLPVICAIGKRAPPIVAG
jgi:hypothetical protein